MDSPIKKIVPMLLNFSYDEWLTLFNRAATERANYGLSGQTLTLGQVAGRFLGLPFDEDSFYNLLYDLRYKTANVHVLSEELDKTILPKHFRAVQKVFQVNQQEKGLSINRFVAFMQGHKLLPFTTDSLLSHHLQYSFIEILKTFEHNHEKGMHDPDFRRVLIDMVKWLWNHLCKWLKDTDLETAGLPKVVWYGPASKSEAYFLAFLIKFGCDVAIFNPTGQDDLSAIDPDRKLGLVYQHPSTGDPQPYPAEERRRESTVAFRATNELQNILGNHESVLFRPWQLRNHIPKSVTLKTTFDEVFLIAKENAFIRPGFEVNNNQVIIPSLFAKIAGISRDRKDYWAKIHQLTTGDVSICLKKFPVVKQIKGNYLYHYQQSLDRDGSLSPEKIIAANWWPYSHLPTGLQMGIAGGVCRYCDAKSIKPAPGESPQDTKTYLFQQGSAIPEQILKLLQKFDYPQAVPKVVLFNNGSCGQITREDACLLVLLDEIGIDIILLNPAGYNDIEMFIEDQSFDTHWLEEVVFNQEFQDNGSSILNKVLGKFF